MSILSIINSNAFKQGITFGIISSTMTVLGLTVGIWTSGGEIEILIASILGLSISNALADSFSMYMSNKATKNHNKALTTAIITGLVEFLLPVIFTISLLFFKLNEAIKFNIIIGILLISCMGYYVSKLNKEPFNLIIKRTFIYISILFIILVTTSLTGKLTNYLKPFIKKFNSEFTKNK
jgi:putative Mn2+ efflux pump MntP